MIIIYDSLARYAEVKHSHKDQIGFRIDQSHNAILNVFLLQLWSYH